VCYSVWHVLQCVLIVRSNKSNSRMHTQHPSQHCTALATQTRQHDSLSGNIHMHRQRARTKSTPPCTHQTSTPQCTHHYTTHYTLLQHYTTHTHQIFSLNTHASKPLFLSGNTHTSRRHARTKSTPLHTHHTTLPSTPPLYQCTTLATHTYHSHSRNTHAQTPIAARTCITSKRPFDLPSG